MHTHLEQWAANTAAPGEQLWFGASLKGLTSVVHNSCRSRDSNPQPRITSPTLYPLGHNCPNLNFIWAVLLPSVTPITQAYSSLGLQCPIGVRVNWSVHTIWTPGINFTGRHSGHGWLYGSACAWCILMTPLGLTPTESWFWVVPCHSTALLYLFPYSVSRCSTS